MPMEMIYFTAANRQEVLQIGRALVEDRLVACVNVLGEITSLYRWEGAVQEETEVAAIAKTSSENVPRVIERVKSLHSYTCPCVVSWPIQAGHPAFLQWIEDETRS